MSFTVQHTAELWDILVPSTGLLATVYRC